MDDLSRRQSSFPVSNRVRSVLAVAVAGALVSAWPSRIAAQIHVRPTGVNVASQSATTVFLTFEGLTADQSATEAFWCGELVDARPDVGLRCDPATLFGRLPLRFDLSQRGSTNRFTDVMTIPASVARRAYQEAARGRPSAFFYVRRFVNRRGGADVYVAVTCRLTGGGATTPLSLTDVRVTFDESAPVPVLQSGVTPPVFAADIAYTGTGRVKGRWEVVRPGEDLPAESDLLTEASLPAEDRAAQRRYTQIGRFNMFVPPGGRLRIAGPDPSRLPRDVDGTYLVLLRIEASDDRDGITDSSGVSSGPIAAGAVAGFPMPMLRYLVGSDAVAAAEPDALPSSRRVALLLPVNDARPENTTRLQFVWASVVGAARYRVEIEQRDGTPVFDAVVGGGIAAYTPPPFLRTRAAGAPLRWRVRAIDVTGRELARSAWRTLTLGTT